MVDRDRGIKEIMEGNNENNDITSKIRLFKIFSSLRLNYWGNFTLVSTFKIFLLSGMPGVGVGGGWHIFHFLLLPHGREKLRMGFVTKNLNTLF